MKNMLVLFAIIFINSSFISVENPIYKIEFTGIDCYFEVLINNQKVYKNENQYKVSKSLNIDKFLEKKDSQTIDYVMYNRETMMEMTEKSNFKLFITKHIGSAIDTIYKSNIMNKGMEDEKGKMRFSQRISHHGFFLLN